MSHPRNKREENSQNVLLMTQSKSSQLKAQKAISDIKCKTIKLLQENLDELRFGYEFGHGWRYEFFKQ